MKDIVARLQALGPLISRICEISGTPGISIGVLHHNEVIHTTGYGYRDVERKLPADADTVYHIASMSKAFTTAALGILVEDGQLSWNSTVQSLFPDFRHSDPVIEQEVNIVDIMAHRVGWETQNNLWMQEFGRLSLAQKETLPMMSTLNSVYPFRSKYLYNNWGYGLAGILIERLSGLSWGKFLEERIFNPLGLKNTWTVRYPPSDKVAQGYLTLDDGSPLPNERPYICDGSVMSGAAGVQTSVNDLLVAYKALLNAAKYQQANNATSMPGSPFKQLPFIFSSHIPIPTVTENEKGYSLGWIRTVIPNPLGDVGLNGMYVPKMPVVGRGSKRRLVWHHNGSFSSFLSSVHLLPESSSAIIVLTNSLANNDCADWIGQLLLETLIDNPSKIDFEALALQSSKRAVDLWKEIPKELAAQRIPNTSPKPLESYSGKYFNAVKDWFLEVFVQDSVLHMCMQGDRRETYQLSHYHYDEFTWVMTQNENAQRGRWPYAAASFYVIRFQAEGEKITGAVWAQGPDWPKGNLFVRGEDKETSYFLENKSQDILAMD